MNTTCVGDRLQHIGTYHRPRLNQTFKTLAASDPLVSDRRRSAVGRLVMAWTCFLALFALLATAPLHAQDAIPMVIVSGLNNPSGVAVQPNTGHVFVADSGAGRIVRVINDKIEPVIVDFPTEKSAQRPNYDLGPLGILFLDQQTLIVGGGGLPAGEDVLQVFKIPSPGKPPIQATATHGKNRSLPQDSENRGLGNYYGVATGARGVFVSGGGDELKGWISLATLSSKNQVSKFERLIASRDSTFTKSPTAITISPQGYVAVGQMGDTQSKTDSRLAFFSEAGEPLGSFETGLHDITGLAYGPRHGRLFATDVSWANPQLGGLYKLVGLKDDSKCEAVLMSALERPTALAFNNNGNCFVTLAGTGKPGATPDGKLVIIKQLDVDPNK